MGWRSPTGFSTDVEPQGKGKQVLWHPGAQAVIVNLEQEMVGIMALEPRVAKDYFVYGCGDDEEVNYFLVHGSHSEGEGCCDCVLNQKRGGEQIRGDVLEEARA